MARKIRRSTNAQQMKSKSLQKLRKEAGFRTAKEFAQSIGIPPTTYARYEQCSDGLESRVPLKAAWIMADALDCSIDMVVGRIDIEAIDQNIQLFYDRLSKSSQQRFDEYMEFLQYRDCEHGYESRRGSR